MEDLIRLLSVGGDIGIWALVYIVYRFDNRLLKLEITMQSHIENDGKAHKQFETRLNRAEDKRAA